MSSLRLAIQKSLQETGGGTSSFGHGEKKKRKKKKSSISGGSVVNGNSSVIKKGRRDEDSGGKRKRGRPRKHPRSQDHDDNNLTVGDDQPRRADRRRDRPRTSRHDVDEEDEDDEYYSENEFSYTEEDSDDGDDESDEDDESIDDDDDSPYSSRSRARKYYHEDEEGEEDETIHSDEDDLRPQPSERTQSNGSEKHKVTATNDEIDRKDEHGEVSQQQDKENASEAQKATNSSDGRCSESKGAVSAPSEAVIPSNVPVNVVSADDEMMRKKLKLLKLKKKLEKNKNFAAHKIQSQWKKKKVETSSQSKESIGEASSETDTTGSVTTKTSIVAKDNKFDTKEDSKFTSKALAASAGASSKPSATNIGSQPKNPKGLDQSTSVDGVGSKIGTSSSNNGSLPRCATTITPSISSAVAGDRGNTDNTGNGKEQPQPAKKNKKKNKNDNGVVPAPTRELREWADKMSIKEAREYIQVGMRVKVRFATQVKRDGKLVQKKMYYGGQVAGQSKKLKKIRIIYDDGTSEWSKFPDRDVVVDAVDNMEHSVPADKFIPPPEDQPVETDGDGNKAMEDGEEGEVTNRPNVATATETEEGEVEEDTECKTRVSNPNSSDPSDIQTTRELNEPTDQDKASTKTEIAVKIPQAIPSPPSSGLSSTPLSKKEKTSIAGSSSNTLVNDQVKKECVPSPSQEEGELSPGITNTSDVSEGQRHQITQVVTESKPLPLLSLLPSAVGSEKLTTEPIKFAADNPPSNTLKVVPVMRGQGNSNVKIVKEKKKLSIRIPSNSLATIKSFSSPKSAGGAKSPMLEPPTSIVGGNMNDILTDTPESKKEITTKRKRVAGDGLPSVDISSGQVSHVKKRIKVSIGKNLLEKNSSKTITNDLSTKVPKEVTEEGLVEENLASIPEEPMPTVETKKKKKKKADSARSPRPKSSLLNPEADKIKNNNNSSQTPSTPSTTPSTPKQQKIGSKGSAFSAKKSIVKEEGAKQTSLKASSSKELIGVTSALRTGRKAAEEAKEKMSVKQKAKLNAKEPKEKELPPLESSKKKKKRRREKETEEQGEESDVDLNETEWVQCDACKKWRVLPDNVKASSLPDLWYCHMNVYDPKRSKCEAPEQNMKQILRERKKRARKRAKREAELAESQQEKTVKKSKQQEEETTVTTATSTTKKKIKPDKHANGGNTPRSVSPKLTKSIKVSVVKSKESIAEGKKATAEGKKATAEGKKATADGKKATAEAKRANIEGNKKPKNALEEHPNPTDSGSDTQKEVKKKSKKGKKEIQENLDNQDLDADKKSGRKRGRPSNRKEISSNNVPTSSANDNEDEDNVEWVQCDKCQKWRKLPPDISADELPGSWDCSMNTWNPSSASCQAAEDKTDAHHQEVGASEWQLRQTHAGKYSYRQMIFGTGARKHNRPLSERARAAESLFIQTNIDEENSHLTTQYTKSSAFLPRISNFQKNLAIEENSLGIFDVLRHSNLWEDLRTMDMNPAKVLSTSAGDLNIPGQKLKMYDCLSDEIKHAMQDVVLQTLEFGCLTGEEVIRKAQWFPYDTSIKGVAGIRGYCNEDIIIHTLLDLVRDGMVEMATVQNPFCTVTQWVPRYRRVGTRRAIEAVEAIKASRCMKIAKPWKQRPTESTTTTEWVTGQKVN